MPISGVVSMLVKFFNSQKDLLPAYLLLFLWFAGSFTLWLSKSLWRRFPSFFLSAILYPFFIIIIGFFLSSCIYESLSWFVIGTFSTTLLGYWMLYWGGWGFLITPILYSKALTQGEPLETLLQKFYNNVNIFPPHRRFIMLFYFLLPWLAILSILFILEIKMLQ